MWSTGLWAHPMQGHHLFEQGISDTGMNYSRRHWNGQSRQNSPFTYTHFAHKQSTFAQVFDEMKLLWKYLMLSVHFSTRAGSTKWLTYDCTIYDIPGISVWLITAWKWLLTLNVSPGLGCLVISSMNYQATASITQQHWFNAVELGLRTPARSSVRKLSAGLPANEMIQSTDCVAP